MMHGDGFLIVYSITKKEGIQEAARVREKILRIKETDTWPMVLVGNKSDLNSDREVLASEGQDLARSWKIPFIETSAKTRHNVGTYQHIVLL